MGTQSSVRGGAFRLLLCTTVLGFGGYALLLPVVPLWVAHGGSGAFGAGASTGVFMLFTVLSQFGVPWLLRRIGHRWVLGIGLALVGAPAPAFALSAALAPVLGLSAVRGVGFGLLTVGGAALVAELAPAGEHGRASAWLGVAIGLPQLTLLPLGVTGVDRLGFPVVLALGASPLLALPLVPFLGPPARAVARAAPSAGRGEGGRAASAAGGFGRAGPGGWAVTAGPVVAMLACATAQGGLVTFLPLVAEAGAVTVALFGTAVGALAGRLVAGELVDRYSLGGRLLAPGVAFTLVGMLVEVFAVSAEAPAGLAEVGVFSGGALLVGLGFGLVQNDSLVALFAAAGPARYGHASAVWNIAYDAGTGVGALGLGAVAQAFGFGGAFGVAAALVLVATPFTLRRRPC
ncbi:MFS family permease [Pseudonocardia eucalypti]|nr:MFS family permease [Pseudonocardia eucalypti]